MACNTIPDMTSRKLLSAVCLSMLALGAALTSGACGKGPADNLPPWDSSSLYPPPEGKGFQLETPDISVGPGEEIQNCYFYKVRDLMAGAGMDANGKFNLHRVQIAQRDGSHHMNIFRVRTILELDPNKQRVYEGKNGDGLCFKSPQWADWPLIANSQVDGQQDWTFPEGVANVLDPDEWIMLQTHYVNASTQATPTDAGRVRVNFWHIPQAEVVHEMGTLFATKQSIRVCESNPEPQFNGSCSFGSSEPVTVIGANGHFHSRGKQFQMFAWDGESASMPPEADRFYVSERWDDPPMLTSPDLSRPIAPGGGVYYTCSYQWTQPEPAVGCSGLDEYDLSKGTSEESLDCCYTFGPVVEKNEHCNIFVYYYPKSDDVNCF